MVELKVTAPDRAELLADGAPAGECRWTWKALSWGRERVKVAQVERFTAPEDRRADFWAYLTFLFQQNGAAAATLEGTYFWFSQALQKSWEAAGKPEAFSEEVPHVQYRELRPEELDRALFGHFIRRQVVTDCWRREAGAWVIRADPFVDDWSEEDYRVLLQCLRRTAAEGGFVLGAFVDGALKGFAAVTPGLFGGEQRYMDLAAIHVSADVRGRGIGAALFRSAMDWARAHGAGKLYISAHSAVESQAFYQKMGCVDAQVLNRAHVEAEPFDRQLEVTL